MFKKIVLASAVALFMNVAAQSQHSHRNCGTMDALKEQLQNDPTLKQRMDAQERDIATYVQQNQNVKTNAITTIPVVFHILYNTAAQNISDARIFAQLDVMNKDFARLNADAGNTPGVFSGIASATNIQFCLAQRDPNGAATTGIVRKATTVTSFSSAGNPMKFSASGGADAWPTGTYLNFWVCNLGGGLLGYAQFPGGTANTDGVVCLTGSVGGPSAPGTSTPYNLGRTATHEVGHWLNLSHIWGDANCGNDQVADTPTQQTSNFGCPTFPKVTCGNGPNGDMFMNYMDYVDDACMNAFTAGQSLRIDATINGARASLKTSLGCTPPNGGCGTPASLSASAITSTTVTLNWAAVPGASSYNVQYSVVGAGVWINTTSATNSKGLTGLVAATNYEYRVQAVCNGATSAYSSIGNYTTSSSGGCGVPNSLSATSITSTTATLNWSATLGALSYKIQYRVVGATIWVNTTSTLNTKPIAGLVASTNYQYRVRTVCAGGVQSAFSAISTFTTSAPGGNCANSYEPNNTNATFTVINVSTDIYSMIGTSTDVDWYKFSTVSPNIKIKATLSQLPFDYDLELYSYGNVLLASSLLAGTSDENVIRNGTTTGSFKLRVFGYNGAFSASSCYKLRVNVSSTNWTAMMPLNERNPKVAEELDINAYPNPTTSDIAFVFRSDVEGKGTIVITDITGRQVHSVNINVIEGTNTATMNIESLTEGVYVAQIYTGSEVLKVKIVKE